MNAFTLAGRRRRSATIATRRGVVARERIRIDVSDKGLDKQAMIDDVLAISSRAVPVVITGPQLKAARALAGLSQRDLAEASGLSLPTIQRMEASRGTVRGVVESLTRVIAALDAAGVVLIGEGEVSHGGGRGVRRKLP